MYLIKRKSVFCIRYNDEIDNHLKQVSTHCRNKKDALNFLSRFQTELKQKKKLQFITLENFKDEYLEHVKRIHSQHYYIAIERTFNRLIKVSGDIPLVKLDRITLEKFLFHIFSNAKYNARLYHINLRASLNYAVSRNYIESNPLNKFRLPKLPEKVNLYISESDFSLIIDKTDNKLLKNIFLFAYNTGMRLSEITNLKWTSISFNESIIKIENSDTFTTKSKKSRIIPINAILLEVIQRLLPKVMDITKNIYVFNKHGVKLNNDYVSRNFKSAVREAILNDDFHFHLLRASFISNLAKRNVPLSAIQKLVGHENIRVTEKHYLSVQNETLIRAMQTLEVNNRPQDLRNAVELLN